MFFANIFRILFATKHNHVHSHGTPCLVPNNEAAQLVAARSNDDDRPCSFPIGHARHGILQTVLYRLVVTVIRFL